MKNLKKTTEPKAAKPALPPKPMFAKKDGPAPGKKAKAKTAAAKPAKAPKPVKAKAAAKPAAGPAKPRDVTKAGKQTKRATAAALLVRKDGTTLKEVLEATGWPSISMPQLAKASNLTLRTEKVKGSPTRYFGTPA